MRAQVQLQSEQQTLVSAETQYAKDKIALNRRMGIAADQEVTLTDTVPYVELAHAELPDAMTLAFQRRKDLLSLESQMEVAEPDAEGGALPEAADAGAWRLLRRAGRDARTVSRRLRGAGQPEGSDLQRGGVPRRARGCGRAAPGAASSRSTSLRVTIEQQIRSSHAGCESANELVKVAQSNVELSRQELSDAQQRFLAGVTDNLPVVEAEARLAGSQSQVVRTMYQYNAAKLVLARNVGVVESQYKQLSWALTREQAGVCVRAPGMQA